MAKRDLTMCLVSILQLLDHSGPGYLISKNLLTVVDILWTYHIFFPACHGWMIWMHYTRGAGSLQADSSQILRHNWQPSRCQVVDGFDMLYPRFVKVFWRAYARLACCTPIVADFMAERDMRAKVGMMAAAYEGFHTGSAWFS